MVPYENDIKNCLQILNEGGTILYPTDTVWGIGCDATNGAAVKKIYELKMRDDAKSLIVLLASEKDIFQYVAAPDPAVFNFLEAQTKPTTLIFNDPIGFADNLTSQHHSIAIRVVQDEFCRHLIKRFKKPIVSTSANVSGSATPKNFGQIDDKIKNGVDYVVQYRQDDLSQAQPSRIISWKDGRCVVLRE